MLRTSVTKFNEDLNNLSSHIKSKQTSQIRQTIKNKAYSSAGMVQKVEVMPTTIIQSNPVVIQDQVIFSQPSTIKIEHQLPTDLVTSQPQTSSHMTLNAINAQEEEEEMDDGSFDNNVKLESTSYTDVSWNKATSESNNDDGDEFLGDDDHDEDFWTFLDIKKWIRICGIAVKLI